MVVSKRKRNHIEKAMSRSKGAGQILVTEQESQPIFHEDEFTIHKPIEKALRNLVIKAREIEVNKKQLVNSVAWEIENELKKMNREELVCHISEVMLSALRRNKVNWSIAYLRKVLPEKYKDPTKRQNALTRFQRAGPPGMPPDTGKTAEELEQSLNRPEGWGQGYIVRCNIDHKSVDGFKPIMIAIDKDTHEYTRRYPVIVRVKPAEQDATVEFDIEEYTKMIENHNNKVDELIKYTYELEKEYENKEKKQNRKSTKSRSEK